MIIAAFFSYHYAVFFFKFNLNFACTPREVVTWKLRADTSPWQLPPDNFPGDEGGRGMSEKGSKLPPPRTPFSTPPPSWATASRVSPEDNEDDVPASQESRLSDLMEEACPWLPTHASYFVDSPPHFFLSEVAWLKEPSRKGGCTITCTCKLICRHK